jgi:hypothetical protein
MNLDESATGTVGLLPHQLADLRRSGLSDDTICVPIVITAELQKRCVGGWVGQIKRTAPQLTDIVAFENARKAEGLQRRCPASVQALGELGLRGER